MNNSPSFYLFSVSKLLFPIFINFDNRLLQGSKFLFESTESIIEVISGEILLGEFFIEQYSLSLVIDLLLLVKSFLEIDSILLFLKPAILFNIND